MKSSMIKEQKVIFFFFIKFGVVEPSLYEKNIF